MLRFVPRFLKEIVLYLSNPSLIQTVGIFRNSGSAEEVYKLISLSKNGENPPFSSFDVHVVAGVLKHFFGSLPVPLFPFEYFDVLIHIGNCHIKESIDLDTTLRLLMCALYDFPPPHTFTFLYLFRFLDLVRMEEINRMNADNLGIVFGPVLLRPRTETIHTALSFATVSKVCVCACACVHVLICVSFQFDVFTVV